MSDLECPYCDADLEVCHDDGFGCDEGEYHEMECPHCEKNFVFQTSIIFSYEPRRADCLNEGGEHDWQPTMTVPKKYTKMRCAACDNTRPCTEEEMSAVLGNTAGSDQ
jgi:hypothetical protein